MGERLRRQYSCVRWREINVCVCEREGERETDRDRETDRRRKESYI